MKAQLRAELLKQRSTRTNSGLVTGMLGLVLFVVLLHAVGLAVGNIDETQEQLMVFGRGEFLGALFAALLGAMSITGEIRHGTIRPTFLVTPSRRPVIAAKVLVSMLIGAGFGLAAGVVAAGVGAAGLTARGIDVRLDAVDFALLLGGSAVAASLWAAIGVGVGAVVRNQVPAIVGICAWLLFVEGLLVGDIADITRVGRFAPGAAGEALSGQGPGTLLAPALALVVLVLWAAVSAVAGSLATARRDVV
ncbi:MAG: ABC transporter permease [Actinomycetota bacterium]|nr:ABC transporter permease [Actinomycetota bacterium]